MDLSPKALDFQAVCSKVLGFVDQLLDPSGERGPIDKLDFRFMFQDVYDLCNAQVEKSGTRVPSPVRLSNELKEHLQKHAERVYELIKTSSDTRILKIYNERFHIFYLGTTNMDIPFRYHNNYLVPQTPQPGFPTTTLKPLPVYDVPGGAEGRMRAAALAMRAWQLYVYEPLKTQIVKEILAEFEFDRKDEASISTMSR
eukprot:m.61636 g.61636  ORF g.61636 m.61636 type:complete len:199 (+) comp11432_c0_seq1:199-795(+)